MTKNFKGHERRDKFNPISFYFIVFFSLLKWGPTEKTFKHFELQGVWFDQIFAAIVFSTLIKHWTHLFISNVDVIWCHWMSFNVIWYLAMSFNVFWCLVMPFYAFWCLSMPFDAFWCLFMSFDVFWWLLMVCDVFRFDVFGWLSMALDGFLSEKLQFSVSELENGLL